MVVPVNFFRKTFSKNSFPFWRMTRRRVIRAETRGMTTNNTTESKSVFQGIAIPLTPNKKPTMGKKATKIIKSLMAT